MDTQVLGSSILRHLSSLLNDANFTARLDYNRTVGVSTWDVGEEYSLASAYRSPYKFYLRIVFTCANIPTTNFDKSSLVHTYACDRMFGDSDEDMESCLLGNDECVPYRILRSPRSSYKRGYNPNLYNEPIVNETYD